MGSCGIYLVSSSDKDKKTPGKDMRNDGKKKPVSVLVNLARLESLSSGQ
jgi:hypothetical protein